MRTPIYSSTSSIEFLSQSPSPQASGSSSLTGTQISTDVELVSGGAVRAEASRILKAPAPPVTVAVVGTTSVAELTVQSPDAVFAADAANAYARAYANLTKDDYLAGQNASEAALTRQINSLQGQIQTVSSQIATTPGSNPTSLSNLTGQLTALYSQQAQLKTELAQLQLAASQSANGANIVTLAKPSSSPSSPNFLRDAGIAFGAGLVAGIGLALLWDFRDDRIRNRSDLEEALGGVPAIGIIPLISTWRDHKAPYLISSDRPNSPTAEAYRALRTSVRFMALERPLRTLVVTSPAAADGKTTTSANLAVILAQAGQRVILVGCDLRRPRIHQFFGCSNDVGFTSVLIGETSLEEVLIDVPDHTNLQILASGPTPPNPSELLAGREASNVLKQLAELADIVVLDCPPVLPVTDATVLATQTDGVLLVTSAGISTRASTSRALELLHRVDAQVIGAVLNRAPEIDAYAYYHYGYGYREAYSDKGRELEPATDGVLNGPSSNGATDGPSHARRKRSAT